MSVTAEQSMEDPAQLYSDLVPALYDARVSAVTAKLTAA